MTTFTIEYRVIYGDSDPFDVMYYARYLDLFERGRTECMRSLGVSYRELEEQGIYSPVREVNCRYRQSVRYDDLLVIETSISRVKKASMRFNHFVYRKKPRTLLAEGYTDHAFVSEARKPVPIPDVLAEKLQKLLGNGQ